MPEPSKPGTLVFQFEGPAEHSDWLIAELSELGFAAFQELDDGLRAFIAEDEWGAALNDSLARALLSTEMTERSRDRVASKNWNAQWEAGIEPVEAGPFVIHPPWHPPTEGLIPICIEPKMSFGTGHHETTRLVLSLMSDVVKEGMVVLDAGTGTAVLAIAARLMGAESVVAFDIDPWSSENAPENLHRNQVEGVDVRHGGIETAGDGPFDLILANINRNVLIGMLPDFERLLGRGGGAILSGILVSDRPAALESLNEGGWQVERQQADGEWWAVFVSRPHAP